MAWKLDEFILELEADPSRRVLFVEGKRDLSFWRNLIPEKDRGDTVVYCIDSVEYKISSGGNRSRLIAVAKEFMEAEARMRVAFFADADFDRVLSRAVPENVILTDGRDLEAYAFNDHCLRHLCATGFARSTDKDQDLLCILAAVARPIGILRVLSHVNDINLPFQRIHDDDKLKKYIDLDNKKFMLESFLTMLLQRAGIGLGCKAKMLENFTEMSNLLSSYHDNQIIHGKDFIYILSKYIDADIRAVEALVFMSISDFKESIMKEQEIIRVVNWVKSK